MDNEGRRRKRAQAVVYAGGCIGRFIGHGGGEQQAGPAFHTSQQTGFLPAEVHQIGFPMARFGSQVSLGRAHMNWADDPQSQAAYRRQAPKRFDLLGL